MVLKKKPIDHSCHSSVKEGKVLIYDYGDDDNDEDDDDDEEKEEEED